MKTKKNLNTMKQVLGFSIMLLLLATVIGCSKDDVSPSEFIKVASVSYDFTEEINNCTTIIGTGSDLSFKVKYEVSEGTEIMEVFLDVEKSGGETEDFENLNFSDNGSQIEIPGCFRFESNTWADFSFRLESANGIVSNSKTVRVDKPAGAL